MSHKCRKQYCTAVGTARCVACHSDWYCSVECQRVDWKVHKITCGKNFLRVLELQDYLEKALKRAERHVEVGENEKAIDEWKKTLFFCEYQFGDKIDGSCYRRRENGVMMKEWQLFSLRHSITETYIKQHTVTSLDSALAFALETRAELVKRKSDTGDRSHYYRYLYDVDRQLGDIYEEKVQCQKALYHKQEALISARHEGPGYTEDIFSALGSLAAAHTALKTGQGIPFAEDAYNLVVAEYGPEHHTVQAAAMTLIAILQDAGRFKEASEYAHINYDSLKSSQNVEDKQLFALAKMQVARSWLLTPPDKCTGGPEAAEQAETLAGEACNMLITMKWTSFEDATACHLSSCYATLAQVMMARGDVTSDVESILNRALSLSQDCRVGVVPSVKSSSDRHCYLRVLGQFYVRASAEMSPGIAKDKELQKAKSAYEESLKICRALFSPNDRRVSNARDALKTCLDLM